MVNEDLKIPDNAEFDVKMLFRVGSSFLFLGKNNLDFTLLSKSTKSEARAGYITTERGRIDTPVFMPVGTGGSVKNISQDVLKNDINTQIILANTYHLYLRPGVDILGRVGGIHKFMSWPYPILTDSGGYQVFSLANSRKIEDDGVVFRSHIDGSIHRFTPEKVIDLQRKIGADIIMAFDECPPGDASHRYAEKSLSRTHSWLERCRNQFEKTHALYDAEQTLFAIVQGCVYEDLRRHAAEFCTSLDFAGYAIGGLSVGEPAELMYKMLDVVNPLLPESKPRYLMGVGKPENLLEAIARGVDMFDCVLPTRNARHGLLYTSEGIINIKNKKWATDFSPLDENGTSPIDKQYSKAYMRHLMTSNELLGVQLSSIHNLTFHTNLMQLARKNILNGNFELWKEEMMTKITRRL